MNKKEPKIEAQELVERYENVFRCTREFAITKSLQYCEHKIKRCWKYNDFWRKVKNEIQKF